MNDIFLCIKIKGNAVKFYRSKSYICGEVVA